MTSSILFDCVEPVSNCNPKSHFHGEQFNYVDIAAVSPISKNIIAASTLFAEDTPSRARQIIREGDVLVSTVRPNLNAIAHVPAEYAGSIASTGFCVLRSINQKLSSRYLYYWVQSSSFVKDMIEKATGASYPAVSDKIVKSTIIPLPPLPIQQKIAAILDEADALRRKDAALLAKYDQLLQAVFYDMFGDPVKNEKGWEVKKLSEVTDKITDGEHGTVEKIAKGRPYLMAKNIRDGYIDFRGVEYISESDHRKIFKRCNPELGDLLLVCIGATIGRVCIMPTNDEYSMVRNIALIKPNKTLLGSAFLYSCFKSDFMQRQIKATNNSSAQAGLYTGQISNLTIFVPPINLQKQFQLISQNIQHQKSQIIQQQGHSEALFQSLMQGAFKGALV